MIKISIDLKKIDQSKCKSHRNGAKYCDIVLIESNNDKYGNDFMAVQGVSKEEREAGVKGAILGNAKIYESNRSQQSRPANKPAKTAAPPIAGDGPPESDDVPF